MITKIPLIPQSFIAKNSVVIFFMLLFRTVYLSLITWCISMLKHPASQCLGLEYVHKSLFHPSACWIDSLYTESIHQSLWLLMNRFKILLNRIKHESTHFSLKRLTKLSDMPWIDSFEVWIISFFILGSLESIHQYIELFHSSCTFRLSFCCLNWFTHLMNRFTLLILCKNYVFSLPII